MKKDRLKLVTEVWPTDKACGLLLYANADIFVMEEAVLILRYSMDIPRLCLWIRKACKYMVLYSVQSCVQRTYVVPLIANWKLVAQLDVISQHIDLSCGQYGSP